MLPVASRILLYLHIEVSELINILKQFMEVQRGHT